MSLLGFFANNHNQSREADCQLQVGEEKPPVECAFWGQKYTGIHNFFHNVIRVAECSVETKEERRPSATCAAWTVKTL